MKLGIPLLVLGVLLLVLSIPFSVILLIGGFNQLTASNVSGSLLTYASIASAVLGMVLTTIGATRVFKD